MTVVQMNSGAGREQLVVACRLKLGPTQLTTWLLHCGSPNDQSSCPESLSREKVSCGPMHQVDSQLVTQLKSWGKSNWSKSCVTSRFRHNLEQIKATDVINCVTSASHQSVQRASLH